MSTEQGDGFGHRGNGNGKASEGVARAFAGPTQAEFDALADLFLSADRRTGGAAAGMVRLPNGGPQIRQSAREGVAIEGLIVGHLPVLAGAWMGQYLRHVASASGTAVGLVRCTRDHAFVDVAGNSGASPDGASNLGEVVRGIGVDRWIIVASPALEMDLALMAAEGDIAALTVLTGADEAAIVSCYSSIKTLSERAGPMRHGLEIGIALVGADANRAREIGDRLERATGQFLGRPAKIVARIERVSGGGTARVYGGSDPCGPREIVTLLRSRKAAEANDAVAATSAAATPRSAESTRTLEPHAGSMVEAPPQPQAPAAAAGSVSAALLSRHVKGLESLGLSCPYALDVEFARGSDGSLHALVRSEGASGVSQLTIATAWAKAHAGLLARAHGLGVNTVGNGAVPHLFADNASSVRSLLMTDVRVHLLTTLRARDTVVELCVDLN